MLPIEDGLITAHVQDMLVNFTRANLSRHLRSTEASSSSSSSTTNSASTEEDNMRNNYNSDTGFTVHEVVSATFEAVVLHSKQVGVVFM